MTEGSSISLHIDDERVFSVSAYIDDGTDDAPAGDNHAHITMDVAMDAGSAASVALAVDLLDRLYMEMRQTLVTSN